MKKKQIWQTSVAWPTIFLALAVLTPISNGAETLISSQPLATVGNVVAKPNLLFILDNSGSMNWSYMPDDLGRSRSTNDEPYDTVYGYWSAQCNGTAYDPTMTYALPVDALGNLYSNATFSSAKTDGYKSNSDTTDLANSYYYKYSGAQPAMSWKYTGASGTVDKTTTFYTECMTAIGNSAPFTKVTVTSVSAEAQNYANWYSYYRKRYLLMRTSVGRAIQALDSGYRVGFSTITDSGVADGKNSFRDVKDFDSAQKANFYSSLYSVAPNGSTPLRAALSKAGRYYAKAISGQTYDPMQYSCQRNYALLSTDGYWNTGGESDSYGPFQLDGTSNVGQQDATEDRPMRDNTKNVVTTVTTFTAPASRTQTATRSRTLTWTRTSTTVASTAEASGTNKGKYKQTVITGQRNTQATEVETTVTPSTATATYTQTVVSTDGKSAPPTTTNVSYSAWAAGTASTTSVEGDPGTSWSGGTTTTTYVTSPGTNVATFSNYAIASRGNWGSTKTVTSDPDVGTYVAGAPSSTSKITGGSTDSLADVAEYYYKTDLRTSGNCTSSSSGTNQDVCSNTLKPSGRDTATWQHMTTFTIGLGVSGTLTYDRNYLTQSVGSYVDLKNGDADWPVPGNDKDAVNIDDLWHAAVNGRGQYYSALNASMLADAISGVVNTIQEVQGSSSAASTSALELVAGDNNQVYKASYTTKSWSGDLQAYTLNGTDATIGETPVWSAQAKLDTLAPASRKIYYAQPSSKTTLREFNYTNLSADGLGTNFTNLCTKTVVSSQCASLTATEKALANDGTKLVDFLRGVRTYESSTKDASNNTVAALFRTRTHVLGDIINGAPVYVGKPPFSYADAGYAKFVSDNATRKPVVYAAANDGMLHAFSAGTADGGAELWAYVPSAVMSNMYKLADASYESKHQYFVDGAPVMADIKVGTAWKTILVGGLNGGGRGYYALDITNPASPQALWEFTDTNLGLTFGNPVITKRSDGTWVVAFASGYNNTSGDGRGHLYVLNAATGALMLDLATSVGNSSDPSGLAKINAWIDTTTDNTAKRFYGGDLKGNLWRFDVDNLVDPHQSAMLLATFQVDATHPQPITTKPETAEVDGKPVIAVATGRYLGSTDIEDATQQTIYAVKDPLTSTGWGDARASASMVKQTLTATGTTATISNNPVSWGTKAGWWVDLPHSRERVSTNMALQYNTLAVVSAIPNGDACTSGGSSWRYYLNITNGGVLTSDQAGTQWSADALVVGMGWVKLSNGNVRILIQDSTGKVRADTPPTTSTSGAGSVRRTSWRELTD